MWVQIVAVSTKFTLPRYAVGDIFVALSEEELAKSLEDRQV